MVLAPLPRLALIHQKITPALVSFDSISGITSALFIQSGGSLAHALRMLLHTNFTIILDQ
ncbi:MAG: hypothetical protein ACI9FG_001471 [Crocinitomicaceae bacterium]|jgi:hypothetical protein